MGSLLLKPPAKSRGSGCQDAELYRSHSSGRISGQQDLLCTPAQGPQEGTGSIRRHLGAGRDSTHSPPCAARVSRPWGGGPQAAQASGTSGTAYRQLGSGTGGERTERRQGQESGTQLRSPIPHSSSSLHQLQPRAVPCSSFSPQLSEPPTPLLQLFPLPPAGRIHAPSPSLPPPQPKQLPKERGASGKSSRGSPFWLPLPLPTLKTEPYM